RIRRDLLDTAIRGLDAIATSTDAAVPDFSRAVAHQRLGEIFRQTGRAEEARRQFEQAHRLAEDLAAAAPRNLAIAECLRDVCLGIGEVELRAERPTVAERHYRRAVALAEAIAAAEPGRAGARRGR